MVRGGGGKLRDNKLLFSTRVTVVFTARTCLRKFKICFNDNQKQSVLCKYPG